MVFSGHYVSSTNKTDRHHITEILLKVALSTITLTIIQVRRYFEERDDHYIKSVVVQTQIQDKIREVSVFVL
jgi:gluconate kinase